MQYRIVVRAQFTYDGGDFIRRAYIVIRRSDVRQRCAVFSGDDKDVVSGEPNCLDRTRQPSRCNSTVFFVD